MPELKTGDDFPEGVHFMYIPYRPEIADVTACGLPQRYDATADLKTKKVVIFAVPGAFTPTCQAAHLPSYVQKLDELKAKGVEKIICLAYNDAFVMSAWGKANGIKDDSVLFMSDPGTEFSKSIGWTQDERTGRYAIVVDHGKVVYAAKESKKGSIEESGAEGVLAHL